MILTATIRDDNGQAVGALVLNPKTFKTGSEGYYGTTKLELAGVRYQAQMQLVAIHSKAKNEASAA
jgi:hypothetical protein